MPSMICTSTAGKNCEAEQKGLNVLWLTEAEVDDGMLAGSSFRNLPLQV